MVSAALFFVVRWINNLRSPDTPPAPGPRPCPYCRSHIDVSATRCSHCTSHLDESAAAA